MERDCQNCQELLELRWDGEALSEADSERVRAHLDACPTCAGLAREMGSILAGAFELRDLRYERAVELEPMVLRTRRGHPFALGLATSAALAATLLLGLRLGGGAPGAVVAPQEVVVRVAVPMAGAQSVALLGDFTGWERKIPLDRTDGGVWVGELRVPAGRYRYVLVVDDKEMQADPAAPQVVDDGFGGKNSVLDVGGSI